MGAASGWGWRPWEQQMKVGALSETLPGAFPSLPGTLPCLPLTPADAYDLLKDCLSQDDAVVGEQPVR